MHHYAEFMDVAHFDHCLESCESVIESYQEMEERHLGKWGEINGEDDQIADAYRFKPLI